MPGRAVSAGLALLGVGGWLWLVLGGDPSGGGGLELVNASYDPTRELWVDLNRSFLDRYEQETGERVTIHMSHGGSTSQARAILDGLEADVATLAMWSDTDALRRRGLLRDGWEARLPGSSLPWHSTIVFVVRRGNPAGIHDWPDLVRPGVEVITPNPKTSGNGRLSFLAAWASVVSRGGSEAEATEYVRALYRQVPVLDSGARGSSVTFAQRGIGDVHLTWENEAHLEVAEAGGRLEIVYPPVSIRADPHVAVVDDVVDRRQTRGLAEKYLRHLYTDEAQDIIARHHYRPASGEALKRHAGRFPRLHLVPITAIATGWQEAQERFFAEGALFDRILERR